MNEVHQSFLNANQCHDMAKLIMLDELFHTKIMSYTKNPLLININKQLLNCSAHIEANLLQTVRYIIMQYCLMNGFCNVSILRTLKLPF